MKTNFKKIRRLAFDELTPANEIRVLCEAEKQHLGFQTTLETWELVTEILGANNFVRKITLHILFDFAFPLTLPRIYLSPSDYDSIMPIPHVDKDRFICTFDTEMTRGDVGNPYGIVYECIEKSKQIIEDGISGRNFEDFEKEFIAYWQQTYDKKDSLYKNVLSLLDSEPHSEKTGLLYIKKGVAGYNYVLHNNDDLKERFVAFLLASKVPYLELEAFYLKDFNAGVPPFTLTSSTVLVQLNRYSPALREEFIKYINSKLFPKIVIFKKELQNNNYFLGWLYFSVDSKLPGYKKGKITNYEVLFERNPTLALQRFYPQNISPSRIGFRTIGDSSSDVKPKKFTICGLGSVGSNLVSLLNTYYRTDFNLIDYDSLKIENIGRHLLGFSYIGKSKPDAIKEHLLNMNPLQSIYALSVSAIEVAEYSDNTYNECDYIFVAIGKYNIEKWLVDRLSDKTITKPIFILWVEPYLAGGHVIYVSPEDIKFDCFFENNLYKYNIIDESEYLGNNPKLILNEAGCQTSFMPYSHNNVITFLSKILPHIQTIIANSRKESATITWIGNIELLKQKGISVSNFCLANIDKEVVINGN